MAALTGTTGIAEAQAAEPGEKALAEAIRLRPDEPQAGVIAHVAGPGLDWWGSDGDRHSGRPIQPDSAYRTGSVDKTFTAVVALQVTGEHRIDLDRPVQDYLPGALPPRSADGSSGFDPVTIRQLLTMTSGLPDIDAGSPPATPDEIIRERFAYRDFARIADDTLRPQNRPWPGEVFPPGTQQEYNTLNYRVIGALIERVSGYSFAREVRSRILRPLRLDHTFLPERDPRMPRPHLVGYARDSRGDLVDVSAQRGEPNFITSTPSDVQRFFAAVFRGQLLAPAQQAELFATPDVPYRDKRNCIMVERPGRACFSAGLMRADLPGGPTIWGKSGSNLGYTGAVFATRDFSRSVVVATSNQDRSGSPPPVTIRLLMTAFLN
ncbi:serine hydrolase domain-containing protein [Amycolatopsis halotolerans]|uniref:Serine hydrolase domain-containing protein n=1 Tax=Amycolatopsis halotolerans TaxID=330083 RepID=A0ABV7QF06_9PSEU